MQVIVGIIDIVQIGCNWTFLEEELLLFYQLSMPFFNFMILLNFNLKELAKNFSKNYIFWQFQHSFRFLHDDSNSGEVIKQSIIRSHYAGSAYLT